MPSTRSELPDDDAGLIHAHVEGVPGAFDELYRRYHGRVVAYLLHRMGDRAAAEDVAQDVMIRAMRNLDRFEPSRPLWPWLRRIATNAAIDVSRARKRADALSSALAGQRRVVEDGPDIAEREVLREALEAVPERQRRALTRCYVEGWRPIDAADEFGVNANAFEQLLHRARRNLAKAYSSRDGGGRGRAAVLAWLGILVQPLVDLVERGRRMGAAFPRLPEVAAATAAVAAVVMLSPAAGPTPRTLPEQVIQRPTTGTADVVEDTASSSVPDVGSVVSTPQPLPPPDAAVRPSGAGQPAPPAVGPSESTDTLGPTLSPDGGAPLPPAPESPTIPPIRETIGGCGSLSRQAVCSTLDVEALGGTR